MDYTICASSVKNKNLIKLVLSPTNALEREFFNQLFANGTAVIETIPNSDEIVLVHKEDVKKED